MDIKTCLSKYVGLSTSKCNCLPETELVNTSSIGLFLDSERYSIPVTFTQTKADCDSGGIWDILFDARNRGINEFIGMISREMKGKFGYLDVPTAFFIGGNKTNGTLTIPETYKGIWITPKETYRNGVISITGIQVLGNIGSTFDLWLYKEGDATATETVNVVNYDGNMIDVDWSVNTSDKGREVNWYVVGDYLDVQNNKIKCNCGRREAWMNYTSIRAVAGNALPMDDSNITGSKWANGLYIDASFHCDHSWLCDDNNDVDGLGRQIGEAVYLASVVELLSFVENRPHPFTPTPQEYIAMKKEEAMLGLYARIEYIIDNLDGRMGDCVTCNKSRIGKTSILI